MIWQAFRGLLKLVAKYSPVALSKNEYYDRLTLLVIKKVCKTDSVCVDVGAHNGKILALFIKHCPAAQHLAFEPLPNLFYLLVRKFGSASKVYPYALSNKTGTANFNFVHTHPAYSGLLVGPMPANSQNETISVKVETLDNVVPAATQVALLKLDIEGGEYNALLGAHRILSTSKPYILFEFGKGGADAYGVTPQRMFTLLTTHQYRIYLLSSFLQSRKALNLQAFQQCYNLGKEYFFIACPV